MRPSWLLAGLAILAASLPEARHRLSAITAPILVVHARDDRMNPVEVAETLAAGAPHARFLDYQTGGHLLLGHHAALAETLRDWLGVETASPVAQPAPAS